jgi:predicted nucleic acid-binding protein
MAAESTAALVVLDTNIVLDLFIFSDPATPASVMRDELERVLDYTHLQPRMAFYGVGKAAVLAQFDLLAQLRDVAPRCVYVCKDADDQKFIDLAAQQPCTLVSKDKAVLTMRKRLLTLGVKVCKSYEKASEV